MVDLVYGGEPVLGLVGRVRNAAHGVEQGGDSFNDRPGLAIRLSGFRPAMGDD